MAPAIFICHIESTAKPLAHAHSTYEVSQMTEDATGPTHPRLSVFGLVPSLLRPLLRRFPLVLFSSACRSSEECGSPMGQIQL